MKRIFKYPIEITDVQSLELPLESWIFSVVMQGEQPVIYAVVDSDTEFKENRYIYIYGTGHETACHIEKMNYLGTIIVRNVLYFHVFAD